MGAGAYLVTKAITKPKAEQSKDKESPVESSAESKRNHMAKKETSATTERWNELEDHTVESAINFTQNKATKLKKAMSKVNLEDENEPQMKGKTAMDILTETKIHISHIKMLQDLYDDVKIYPNPLLSIEYIQSDQKLAKLYNAMMEAE